MKARLIALSLCSMVLAGYTQAGEITVSAAASLTNAFKDIARGFEAQNPGSKVNFNFAASGVLLQQMAKGAPVDVFASADQETMDSAVKQKLVNSAERKDFARNALVLIVPSASKLKLQQLSDLQQAGIRHVALGIPASVPVGRYAKRALENARLWPAVEAKAINTQNVRQSLDYVARGEVEAGFVYQTDAAIMPDKVKVAFTVPLDETISYPVARTASAANAAEAQRFVSFLLSPAAQSILSRYGFHKP
jgi:molybdate transport system substrate-binding protein